MNIKKQQNNKHLYYRLKLLVISKLRKEIRNVYEALNDGEYDNKIKISTSYINLPIVFLMMVN